MSKNLFEQIDEEKKDIPKIDKALKQVKKYKYNFYQKVSILTMIICFFMGIILGNIFPSCVSSGLYSATCTTTEYNISLTIFFWFASFLLCMFIYAIGHIINILETINGVGKVKVLLKYSESSQVVAMYNETNSENKTEENDGDGGTKNSTETETKREIVYTDENGTSKPITEKLIMPVIEGAIITAQGASNANIKSSIVSAVEAVTGLAIHKIQVFEMKN